MYLLCFSRAFSKQIGLDKCVLYVVGYFTFLGICLSFTLALILVFTNFVFYSHTHGPGWSGLSSMAQYIGLRILRKRKFNGYCLRHTVWHLVPSRISNAFYFNLQNHRWRNRKAGARNRTRAPDYNSLTLSRLSYFEAPKLIYYTRLGPFPFAIINATDRKIRVYFTQEKYIS